MTMFTRYRTMTTKRSHVKIKAPVEVFEAVANAGCYLTACSNRKNAQVFKYHRLTRKSRYVAPLAAFISDKVCGYRDGNGCNLTKSNLIMMED